MISDKKTTHKQNHPAQSVMRAGGRVLFLIHSFFILLLTMLNTAQAATPIASYSFDEIDWALNATVPDAIGGHDATVNGSISRQRSDNNIAHSSTCSAAQFGGGSLDISGLPISSTAGDKTSVSFWMYWDGKNSVMPMGWIYHDLWMVSGSFGFNSANSDIYGISSSGLANGWHHIVAVFTNGNITDNELYIDGTKQTLTQRQSSPNNGRAYVNSRLRIGGWHANTGYRFSGAIDEFKVYNGALNQTEVNADFTYTSPAACIDPPPQPEGLIASYTFNDDWSSANPLEDTTGAANGTISGALSRLSSPASGNKPETCAAGQFNGGAIDINNLPVSTAPGDKTSISFWMNWNGANSVMPLGFHIHDLWTVSGSFGFNTGGGDIYGIPSTGLANTWHHVTVIFTNNNVRDNKIYIDGVEQKLTLRHGTIIDSRSVVNSHLRLGGWWYNNGYRFRGQLDELKIYTGEVSQETIDADRTAISPCSQPIEYRFDETSWAGVKNEVIDSSDKNYHGTAFKTQPAEGLVCNAADFSADSTDDYIALNNAALNNAENFTISVWAKTKNTGAQSIVSGSSGTRHNELIMWFPNSSRFKPHLKNSAASSISISNIANDQWHHLAWTRNGTENCIYVDGVKSTCQTASSSPVNIANGGLIIGQEQDSLAGRFDINQDFEGLLDELTIFDYVLSASEVSSIRKNNLAGDSWDGQPRACPPQNNLDHFEISYPKTGLTCLPSKITIKACADAACATVITDDVDVTLSPDTGWVSKDITIKNGQITLDLNHISPGTTKLDITASSITPANDVLTCLANGLENTDCSITVSDTGFIFDVPTLTACKTSANVTIKAIKTDDKTAQCVSAFSNTTKKLSFWSEYDTPATGGNLVKINGDDIATSDTGTDIDLTFDADGVAVFTVQYADAGKLNLTATYNDVSNDLVMTDTDDFTSIPVAVVSYSEDSGAECTNQNANCSVFKKAGEPFNQKIKAACWTHDDDTDFTDNPATPNFILAGIGLEHSLIAPSPGQSGTITTSSFNFSASDNGIHTLQQTISEVGVFKFNLNIPTYPSGVIEGENLTSATSPAIGRFIPDHFETTLGNNGNFTSACTGFSYSGQPFTYNNKPQLIVTAYNAANDAAITTNYRGDFVKLSDTDFTVIEPSTDASQLGADNATLVGLDWLPTAATLTDNNDGTLTFAFGDDTYTYLQQANSQIAPFNAAVDLEFIQIQDSDNVATTTLPFTLTPTGETIRFGRVALDSTHGSELAPLSVNLRTEFFNGSDWLPNDQDQCTSLILANHIQLTTTVDGLQAGNRTMTIKNGTTGAALANPIISGNGALTLSPPGQDNQGFVDIRSNISVTYPWLLDLNNGEAQSRASFGLYSGDDNIIFRRERF